MHVLEYSFDGVYIQLIIIAPLGNSNCFQKSQNLLNVYICISKGGRNICEEREREMIFKENEIRV